MTHRVGIIGLGTVGSRFVEQFGLHDAFNLVGAWDPDRGACSAHRAEVPILADAAAVIAAADVVYVAVPPLFHREYVEACLAAYTAIFCEKPLGIDVAESRELVAAVEASGLVAGVNFVFGGAPSARELQRLVESGELGEVLRGDLRLHFAEWPRAWHARAQWLQLRDQGGWVREVVSHFLFVAARILGPLHLAASDIDYPDGPDGSLSEQSGSARFTSASAPLVVTGTSDGAGPDVVDLTIRGRQGSARIWDWYRLQLASTDGWDDVFADARPALGADAYTAQLDQLALMLDGQEHTIATFAEALAVQELVEEMLSKD
ncbi:MAG: Gfo/Idh/MocA family oxidoreductase [Actinomycetota bacterium]|nr:Gfo/Idh/MocA family oxidoreductase [Actinomycetota bacterium]